MTGNKTVAIALTGEEYREMVYDFLKYKKYGKAVWM
jgi:hypothetical protein